MYHDNCLWTMPMMWIWIPVVIISIVLLVKLLDKTNSDKSKSAESPLDVLKRRYANGEIDTEEYEKRKKILEGN